MHAECSRMVQNAYRMFQNVPKCIQNVPEGMQNVPEGMQNVPKCMKNEIPFTSGDVLNVKLTSVSTKGMKLLFAPKLNQMILDQITWDVVSDFSKLDWANI